MSYIPSTVIETVDQLKAYLRVALQLEHATIPPYLTAAYSTTVEANKPSVDLIMTVAKEEMLHFTLVANLMNAIGERPNLLAADFVPRYPTPLPGGLNDFEINIERFSKNTLQTFLKIERPERPESEPPGNVVYIEKTVPISVADLGESFPKMSAPFVPMTKASETEYHLHYKLAMVRPEKLDPRRQQRAAQSMIHSVKKKSDAGDDVELHYYSIGDFYRAIHLGFVELTNKVGKEKLFCGRPEDQIPAKAFFSAGGELNAVTDLKSALEAIDLIAGQGEGSNGRIADDDGELAHYFRFDQIYKGRLYRLPDKDGKNGDEPDKPTGGGFPVEWEAVSPIKKNGKVADYEKHAALAKGARELNGAYLNLLKLLNKAFNGEPQAIASSYGAMSRIKELMTRLMNNPIPDSDGEHAAPTFEMNEVE